MATIRLLVTGAGSAVGQGIIKSFRISDVDVTLIAGDIEVMSAALFRADESLLIPRVELPGALEQIITLIREQRIDGVMVGSEFDLEFFSKQKDVIQKETGARVIVCPYETVKTANDKWLTAEFLRKNDLPYAPSYLPESINAALKKAGEWGYPVLLKSRTGTSSRNVHFIFNEREMIFWYESVPWPMIQKMLGLADRRLGQEYTCSLFKCKNGKVVGPFTSRRTIHAGHSQIVEVNDFNELHPLLLKIGEKMEIIGSLNVQLIVGSQGPVPFEFNARFSGTTAIRAYFGFNEPEMAIRNYFLGEDVEQPKIRKGVSLRYDEQVFVDGVTAANLSQPLPRGEVPLWF